MLLQDFDYSLPGELIAQEPLVNRDASRMLVVHKKNGQIEHSYFSHIADFLNEGDLLIFNDSKVVPARLLGQRPSGGKVEVFLLEQVSSDSYECLLRCTSNQKVGIEFSAGEGLLGVVTGQKDTSMIFTVRFNLEGKVLEEALERVGHVPLPPYIRREDTILDRDRYQTIYARERGSVAAPTAGLHYTPAVMQSLKEKGVGIAFVSLHVGIGTFQPIKTDSVLDHQMHDEIFRIDDMVIKLVHEAKARGNRVIAIGTTSARTLESAARGMSGSTSLYLYPGQRFLWVDGMQTNFHQPKSSLLVMMAAFMGKDLLDRAYAQALKERYRFLSYGDSMLVI